MSVVSTERLADVFVELADTLVDDFDVIEFLLTVTHRAAELIGDADVGLLLADQRGQLQFMAASNEGVKRLELFQVQVHEGPCFDAFQSAEPVVNAELRDAQDRWPRFAPRAVEAGYRAVHAFPLRLRQDVIGAIGVFGTTDAKWAATDVHIAQTLAHVATIGLLQERAVRRGAVLSEQLQSALNSRIVIEQAKGAVAQSRGVSVDEAFAILLIHARRTDTHLVAVAQSALTDPAYLAALSDALPDPIEPAPGRPAGVSPTELAAKRRRGEGLEALLGRADVRDSAAEGRDRAAEERVGPDDADQSRLDRIWAGRDRDSSMVDRADLMDLLNEEERPPADE